MPRPAVAYRSWEIESYRKKVELLNLLWGKYLVHSDSIIEKFPLRLIPNAQSQDLENEEYINSKFAPGEKYKSSDYLDNIEFCRPSAAARLGNTSSSKNQLGVRADQVKNLMQTNTLPKLEERRSENMQFVSEIPTIRESQSLNLDDNEVRRRQIIEAMQKRLSGNFYIINTK